MPEGKFPSNSLTTGIPGQKKTEPSREKMALKGTVKTRKKSLGQKFMDMFLAEDISKLAEHIVYDVMIPKGKDIVSATVDTLLYGQARNSMRSGQAQQSGYVPYSTIRNEQRKPPAPSIYGLVDNIIFDTPEDGSAVLQDMQACIAEYGVVTVGYLYQRLGYPSDQTKENYGWYNVDNAYVTADAGGWILKLPRPVVLSR